MPKNDYYVCRQCSTYTGTRYVEISCGDSNYDGLSLSNCGALVESWPGLGEGQSFMDPREAVKAAIMVRDAWKEAGVTTDVYAGYTGGDTSFFCDHNELRDDDELRAWAKERWEKAPKCDQCGEVLDLGSYYANDDLFDDERFCSEYCIEKRVESFYFWCEKCECWQPLDLKVDSTGLCEDCTREEEEEFRKAEEEEWEGEDDIKTD